MAQLGFKYFNLAQCYQKLWNRRKNKKNVCILKFVYVFTEVLIEEYAHCTQVKAISKQREETNQEKWGEGGIEDGRGGYITSYKRVCF